MSATLLRDAVIHRLKSAREQHIKSLRHCRYQPAVGIDKGILPATTAENIALFANQTNAWIEALDSISEIIDQEHKKLTQPEGPAVAKPKRNGAIY